GGHAGVHSPRAGGRGTGQGGRAGRCLWAGGLVGGDPHGQAAVCGGELRVGAGAGVARQAGRLPCTAGRVRGGAGVGVPVPTVSGVRAGRPAPRRRGGGAGGGAVAVRGGGAGANGGAGEGGGRRPLRGAGAGQRRPGGQELRVGRGQGRAG